MHIFINVSCNMTFLKTSYILLQFQGWIIDFKIKETKSVHLDGFPRPLHILSSGTSPSSRLWYMMMAFKHNIKRIVVEGFVGAGILAGY